MRTGELAKQAGVNQQTLRYYEREGLLPAAPRAANGYRDHPQESLALVRFIKRAQELGFSLDEARALSGLRASPARSRLEVRALATAKLQDIARRIADLSAMRTALRQLVDGCCNNTAPRCPILEALDGGASIAAPKRHGRRRGRDARGGRQRP